jgi:hypothetical protein
MADLSSSNSPLTAVTPANAEMTINVIPSIACPSTYGQATQSIVNGLSKVNGLAIDANVMANKILSWATKIIPTTQIGVVSSSVDVIAFSCKMVEELSTIFSKELSGVNGASKTQLAFACSKAFLYCLAQAGKISPNQYETYCGYVDNAEEFENTASSIYNIVTNSSAFQAVKAETILLATESETYCASHCFPCFKKK